MLPPFDYSVCCSLWVNFFWVHVSTCPQSSSVLTIEAHVRHNSGILWTSIRAAINSNATTRASISVGRGTLVMAGRRWDRKRRTTGKFAWSLVRPISGRSLYFPFMQMLTSIVYRIRPATNNPGSVGLGGLDYCTILKLSATPALWTINEVL